MLRGINVSGQKIVRMQELRKSCTGLGFGSVETYVQSGNIVFLAPEKSPLVLSKKISQAVLRDFGFAVPVLVKSAKALGQVLQGNPFLKEKGIDLSKLHVTFLSEPASKNGLGKLETLSSKPDRFCVGRQEIYLHCPGGYGKTKLSNTAIEKALSAEATTRNWKTVNALFEMASRLE